MVLTAASGSTGVVAPQGFRTLLYSDTVSVHYADDLSPPRVTGLNSAIEFVISGGNNPITTGQYGHLEVPFNCTIKRSTLMADQVGSIVVNIWKTNFAGFPPTSGNKITASAPPTLTAAQAAQDSTLTGWTTALTAGDILAYNVDSTSGVITRITESLLVGRTGL